MLVRFGSTGDPQVAERTATTCSLAPDAADDFAVVEGLAERAVRGNEKHRYFRYFAYCKGITEYRSGNDAEAVKWLRRFSPRAGGDGLDASVFSVLAMANHRMGKTQDANAALHEATAIVSAKMPDGSKDRPFVGTNYREWLPCRLLVREAETLLN